MKSLEYLSLSEVAPALFLPILNSDVVRKHLMTHERFNCSSIEDWIALKLDQDASPGCKIRAIRYQAQLAGWCGIQREAEDFELAMVLDPAFWGIGKTVFRDMMGWAKTMGHTEVCVHFLASRKVYRFMQTKASSVYQSQIAGNRFTTYRISII